MNDYKEKFVSFFSLIPVLGEGRESKAEVMWYVGCKCKVVGWRRINYATLVARKFDMLLQTAREFTEVTVQRTQHVA